MMILACQNQKQIPIIARAENAKAGALIISNKDQKMYYLDGVDFWPDSVIGKMIEVEGVLRVEDNASTNENEELNKK